MNNKQPENHLPLFCAVDTGIVHTTLHATNVRIFEMIPSCLTNTTHSIRTITSLRILFNALLLQVWETGVQVNFGVDPFQSPVLGPSSKPCCLQRGMAFQREPCSGDQAEQARMSAKPGKSAYNLISSKGALKSQRRARGLERPNTYQINQPQV